MVREMLCPDPDNEALRGGGFFLSKRLENYGQNPVDYPGLVRDVGRLFLGVDVQCAQCHVNGNYNLTSANTACVSCHLKDFQGTTNPNAGLLAVVPKVAGLVALVRIALVGMPGLEQLGWQLALALAIVTMTLGNLLALWQSNLRRLLAYSSIAHAGYMLIGLAVGFAVARGASEASHFDGVGATLGPALDGVGSRHDRAWLEKHFADPPGVVKDSIMPPYKFAPMDLDAICKYLLQLPKRA